MTIGEKLKQVRCNIGKSRKDFAGGIIDSSYLRLIETNQSQIRASSLVALLQKNNFSVLEFLADFSNIEPKQIIYRQKVDDAFFNHDIAALQGRINCSDCTSQVIKRVAELLVIKLEGKMSTLPQNKHYHLKQVLLQMDEWNLDSIWLLVNIMDIYDLSNLEGLVNSLFHNYDQVKNKNDLLIKLLAQLSLNYLQICLKNKYSSYEIKKAKNYLKNLPNVSSIAYEKFTARELLRAR